MCNIVLSLPSGFDIIAVLLYTNVILYFVEYNILASYLLLPIVLKENKDNLYTLDNEVST